VLLSANLFGQALSAMKNSTETGTPTPLLPTKNIPFRSGMRES